MMGLRVIANVQVQTSRNMSSSLSRVANMGLNTSVGKRLFEL